MDLRRLRWAEGLVFGFVLGSAGCDPAVSASGDTDTDSEGGDASGTDADSDDSASGGSADGGSGAGTDGGSGAPEPTTGDGGGTTGDSGRPDSTTGSDLPDGDGCCEAHAGPGCNEPAPQQCVCEAAPECCVFDWSASCAEAAIRDCGAVCESDDSGSSGGATGDSGPGDDTGPSGACDGVEVFELDASDADLSGDWIETTSMVGEGQIAALQGGVEGSVSFDLDIPCDDQWFIWVRYFEQGSDDSYFATVDGEPSPAGIFEGDCTGGGGGYGWRVLNYRTEDDPLCDYVEDPWAPQWDAGSHNVSFSYRESVALARIVVTNDPDFTP